MNGLKHGEKDDTKHGRKTPESNKRKALTQKPDTQSSNTQAAQGFVARRHQSGTQSIAQDSTHTRRIGFLHRLEAGSATRSSCARPRDHFDPTRFADFIGAQRATGVLEQQRSIRLEEVGVLDRLVVAAAVLNDDFPDLVHSHVRVHRNLEQPRVQRRHRTDEGFSRWLSDVCFRFCRL